MDYAANAGGMLGKQGISNGLENGSGPADITSYSGWATTTGVACSTSSDSHYATGIVYQIIAVRQKDITDGLSKTYAVGEKFEVIDQYGTGSDPADNEWMFVGYDNDTNRMRSRSQTIPPMSCKTIALRTCSPVLITAISAATLGQRPSQHHEHGFLRRLGTRHSIQH